MFKVLLLGHKLLKLADIYSHFMDTSSCFPYLILFMIWPAIGNIYIFFDSSSIHVFFLFVIPTLSHFSMNHCSEIIQLANLLVIMLQLFQCKLGAKTVTKQWKEKMSLRQIKRLKFMLSFVYFDDYITLFASNTQKYQKSINDSWRQSSKRTNATYFDKSKRKRVGQQL